MDMQLSEADRLVNLVEQVPVVGPLWADALAIWIGVVDAMNMQHLADDLGGPGEPNVIPLPTPAPLEPTRHAA